MWSGHLVNPGTFDRSLERPLESLVVQMMPTLDRPVFSALAFANDDGSAIKLDVLDPQLQALGDTHARTVKDLGEQTLFTCQESDYLGHFLPAEHDRQMLLILLVHQMGLLNFLLPPEVEMALREKLAPQRPS